MKILHSETYEREGNDAWLIDRIQIISEDGELILRHRINYTGWGEPIKETREIELDKYDTIEAKQKRIQEYMENEYLTEEMDIPNLKNLLESHNEY